MSDPKALTLLESIDRSLKQVVILLTARAQASSNGHPIASERDLLGQYGNPEIKAKDPRDWNGPPMKGRRFSECPPEYLDLLAERFDYFAEQAEEEGKTTSSGKPVAPYNRKDAALARGWALRIRSGRHEQRTQPAATAPSGWAEPEASKDAGWAAEPAEPVEAPDVDDIPFTWLLPMLLPATALFGALLA